VPRSSSASAIENPRSPNLVAEYATLPGTGTLPGERRDVDHRAAAARDQVRQRPPGQQDRRAQVDVDHRREVGLGQIAERPARVAAGVVDQHVQRAELLERAAHDRSGPSGAATSAAIASAGPIAATSDPRTARAPRRRGSDQHDAGAGLGELARARQARSRRTRR